MRFGEGIRTPSGRAGMTSPEPSQTRRYTQLLLSRALTLAHDPIDDFGFMGRMGWARAVHGNLEALGMQLISACTSVNNVFT